MGIREEAGPQCTSHSRRRRFQKRRRENQTGIRPMARRTEEKVAGKRAQGSEKHMEEVAKGYSSKEMHC